MGTYTKTPKWVMQELARGTFTPRETQVLVYVVDMSRGFNRQFANASGKRIAEATSIRINHVYEVLRKLAAEGFLIQSEQGYGVPDIGPATGTSRGAAEVPVAGLNKSQQRDQKSPSSGTKRVPVAGLTAPENTSNEASSGASEKTFKETLKKTLEEKDRAPAREVLPPGEVPFEEGEPPIREPYPDEMPEDVSGPKFTAAFLAFWVAYPTGERKKGKARVFALWKRLRLTPAHEARLMAALEEDKASAQWRDQAGKYVPGPEPWLNKKRWLDDPPSLTQVIPKAATPSHSGTSAEDAQAKYGWN